MRKCETKMSTTRYKISSIKQLIDLNGKAVNFQLGFKAKSVNNDVFDALVVTQEMLDSNEPLNYQRAEGEISGNITNDNGVYNNYFLCLKSDKPIDIDVGIKINEIPQQSPPQQPPQQQLQQPEQSFKKQKYQRVPTQPQQQPPPILDDYQDEEETIVAPVKKSKKSDYTMIYIFVGVFLFLLLAGFGYYYYTKTVAPPQPAVVESKTTDLILKNVEDGFNNLGLKLNEVSSQVTNGLTDNIGKMEHNLTENLHELSEKIINPPPVAAVPVTSDINNIKESIENIKSHLYTQQSKHIAPDTSGDSMTIVNPNEILSRIKSLPKS